MKSLNIDFKTFYRKKISLIIYSLVDYNKKIGFESEIKKNQLFHLIKCYASKRNIKDIREDIIKLAVNPITKKELMFKLEVKYAKISVTLRKMVKNGKLKIIKHRPMTIVSL